MTNEFPLVVTIIVHYNAPDECRQIVTELSKTDYPNHKIVIVDNCSDKQNFHNLLSLNKPDFISVVQNSHNNGYGGGINFGVTIAKPWNPTYFHVINTDTSIVNPHYIKELVTNFKLNPTMGLIGPTVMDEAGHYQNTIMPFVSVKNALLFRRNKFQQAIIENPPSLHPVQVINGVCFIVKAEALYKINGFDEDFFMYGEEHDFCYRLLKANYQCAFWSGKSIIHKDGANKTPKTFNWRDNLIRSNQILFLIKHKSLGSAYWLALLFSISIVLKKMNGTSFISLSILNIIKSFFNPISFNKKFQK